MAGSAEWSRGGLYDMALQREIVGAMSLAGAGPAAGAAARPEPDLRPASPEPAGEMSGDDFLESLIAQEISGYRGPRLAPADARDPYRRTTAPEGLFRAPPGQPARGAGASVSASLPEAGSFGSLLPSAAGRPPAAPPSANSAHPGSVAAGGRGGRAGGSAPGDGPAPPRPRLSEPDGPAPEPEAEVLVGSYSASGDLGPGPARDGAAAPVQGASSGSDDAPDLAPRAEDDPVEYPAFPRTLSQGLLSDRPGPRGGPDAGGPGALRTTVGFHPHGPGARGAGGAGGRPHSAPEAARLERGGPGAAPRAAGERSASEAGASEAGPPAAASLSGAPRAPGGPGGSGEMGQRVPSFAFDLHRMDDDAPGIVEELVYEAVTPEGGRVTLRLPLRPVPPGARGAPAGAAPPLRPPPPADDVDVEGLLERIRRCRREMRSILAGPGR